MVDKQNDVAVRLIKNHNFPGKKSDKNQEKERLTGVNTLRCPGGLKRRLVGGGNVIAPGKKKTIMFMFPIVISAEESLSEGMSPYSGGVGTGTYQNARERGNQ